MRMQVKVGVVGAGPKGLMVADRLCAHAARLAGEFDLEIHFVDPFPPGSGRVWRLDQPWSLLMNTPAADATVFAADTSGIAGPSLYDWARLVSNDLVDGVEPDWREYAGSVRPDTAAPRAFYGAYLRWAFGFVRQRACGLVRVRVHRGMVTSVHDLPGGGQRLELDGGASTVDVGAVILTQGHFEVAQGPAEREYADAARESGLQYVPPMPAAEADLSSIAAGKGVILRGLGLSFYDYVALLTVGRDGRFRRSGTRLRYEASGSEPVIYAGSWRGVPYPVRADSATAGVQPFNPRFFTREAINTLRRRGPGVVDFGREIWPLVAKEVGWGFYTTQYARAHGTHSFENFARRYASADWDSPAMRELITEFFPDPAMHWHWDAYARPGADRIFRDRGEFHEFVEDYQRTLLDQASAGPADSPHRAATAVLRRLRDQVRLAVGHHGIAGSSYRRDIEGWFHGMTNFLVAGPPAVRVEQLLALIDAGVVRLLGPAAQVRVDREAAAFAGESPMVNEPRVSVGALIEARLPAADVRNASDPLVVSMLAAGGCRAHAIQDAGSSEYSVGSLDVTGDVFRVVRSDGSAHPARFAYGVPLRGIQGPFGTSLSVAFEHCDAIARAAWTAAGASGASVKPVGVGFNA